MGDDRPSELTSRERLAGWAVSAVLGAVALAVVILAILMVPLVVAAFPLTLLTIAVVLAFGWFRHRRRAGMG